MEYALEYWAEALLGGMAFVFSALFQRLWGRMKAEMEEQNKIKEGLVAILHDRLYQSCSDFITHGEVAVGDLGNVEYMYSSYTALGGNGACTALYNRVKALPLKE